MEGGVAGGIPPYKGGPKARPPKLQWLVVSGMFCWCGLSGTCRLSMRRPSFPARGMTTRLTAPAMAIRSWWTRVLLLWLLRNGKPLCPRRAAVNCNCNFFLSTKGREGPRRRSTATAGKATAGKATAERQRQGFFVLRGQKGLPLQLQPSAVHSRQKKSQLVLQFCPCPSAVAVLSGPSWPLVDKGFDVAVLRGPSWTKGVRQPALLRTAVVDSGVEGSCRVCG